MERVKINGEGMEEVVTFIYLEVMVNSGEEEGEGDENMWKVLKLEHNISRNKKSGVFENSDV